MTKKSKTTTRLYYKYRTIIKYCYNPNNRNYKNYGTKDIKICDDWLKSFKNFEQWSYNNGYGEELSLKRIDLKKNFSPQNCFWANKHENLKSKTRLYNIYKGIKSRCYCSTSKAYKYYGEKGIIVCDEWIESFENFKEWAKNNGYKDCLTIERIDVKGNYCPENCKWVTMKEQSLNKTTSNKISAFGETKNISEWEKDPRINISGHGIRYRINKLNMSTEEALLNNKTAIRQFTIFGETKTIAEWSKDNRCKVCISTLNCRLSCGWDGERALTEEVRKR